MRIRTIVSKINRKINMEYGITTKIEYSKNETQHRQLVFYKHTIQLITTANAKWNKCVDSNYNQTTFGINTYGILRLFQFQLQQ